MSLYDLVRGGHISEARAKLLARLDMHQEQVSNREKAVAIIKPLKEQLVDAIFEARQRGLHPDRVCLGQKQREIFVAYFDALEEGWLGQSLHFRSLPVTWTYDADHVSVHETRKFCWL